MITFAILEYDPTNIDLDSLVIRVYHLQTNPKFKMKNEGIFMFQYFDCLDMICIFAATKLFSFVCIQGVQRNVFYGKVGLLKTSNF